MSRHRKPPDDADRALFREAMRGVKPLAGETREIPQPKASRTRPLPSSAPPETPTRRPAADGSGVQARTRQRLRRGQLRPETTLDLHGLTRDEAHARLNTFLARAHASGRRCVLVITGIGRGSATGGVLRRALPGWLEGHPEVLDSAPARAAR
jgi:DNA-nicking Smr family endonuclease